MRILIGVVLLLLVALPSAGGGVAVYPDDALELRRQGNLARLQGDYALANAIQRQLVDQHPRDPIGYVFNLNTMVTRLTWNERETRFDDQIRADATMTLELCEAALAETIHDYLAHFYCGQAHFALSYLSALRGSYYQAGRHGKKAIAEFERSLALKPSFTDAKMHLGISYYHADHLPPFLKALSWFLWFIPQGNSDKSLPYLRDVINQGEYYRDVAKYLYADIRIYEGPEGKREATGLLTELTRDFPTNQRFHLRYISLLLEQGRNSDALMAASRFLDSTENVSPLNEGLVRLWMTRAHLAERNIDAAIAAYSRVDPALARRGDTPIWGRYWLLITEAQMLDLVDRRDDALKVYESIIELTEDNYVNPVVVSAANLGLEQPFDPTSTGTNQVFD